MARVERACEGDVEEAGPEEGRDRRSDLCARMRRGGKFEVGGRDVRAWRTWWRCLIATGQMAIVSIMNVNTRSATNVPFLVTVLASTTNTNALAASKWSLNWSRNRGCPGMSTMRSWRFDSGVMIRDEFAWSEVIVGRVWLNASCNNTSVQRAA